jgi:hypothetical protein
MSGSRSHSSHEGHGSHGSHAGHEGHDSVDHEMSDVNFTKAVWIIPASMAVLAVYAVVCYFYTASVLTHEMIGKQTLGGEVVSQKFTAFETQQAATMHRYQMSKTNKGAIQIPIERAMQMMTQEAGHTGGADTTPVEPK